MFRIPSTPLALAAWCALGAWSASAQTPAGPPPIAGQQPLARNTYEAGKPVAATNTIVQPVPITAAGQENALAAIDQHLGQEVRQLREQLKDVLPDELAILAKTGGWTTEQQRALTTAVFQAWTQANADDTAGAELVARQTAVKAILSQLDQDVQNNASVATHLKDLEDALNKISAATPGVTDVISGLTALKTWSSARELVTTAVPGQGQTAELPAGKVPLIFDPSMRDGDVVVLGNGAVMIGNEQAGKLEIIHGNAAQALGLPIVTGNPLADAEGQEVRDGVLLVNPETSQATIQYNVNGNRFIMKPGMSQILPAGKRWVVDYDRGEGRGPARYEPKPGTFYFTPTDEGWQLYQKKLDVVLDNAQSPQEFHFLLYGQQETVPAHGTRRIETDYPFAIRYDRGNGSELASKEVKADGTIQIGVNIDDNRWDLFPTRDNEREVAERKLFQ